MTATTILLVALATATATPTTASDADVRELVETHLGAIDRPVSSERWRALGPAAIPILEEVLASDDLPSRRARAASGLAAIGGDRARSALLARAAADGERAVVRQAAIRGAARITPRDQLLRTLSPVLSGARSAHVRATAAEALAATGEPDGCGAVRAQAAREGAAGAARYGRALSRCPGP
jgi:HEAT repeat protein